MNTHNKNFSWFVGTALIVCTVSQITGYFVNSNIPLNSTIEINSLIHFTHVRNFGGVFGLFQGMGWIFGLVSIALLLGVAAYLWLSKDLKKYEYFCFGFIVGGGASNILDRLIHSSVIDFIDIQHIPYWNYVFNVADAMVHIGIWPLLLFGLLADRRENQHK